MAEAALDAIILTDAEGVIQYWSSAIERAFWYSAAEAIGRRIYDWPTPPQ
jgi:PAS domain S-box-containing protein